MIEDAGIDAIRAKSVALTEFAVAVADELLAPARRDAWHRRATPRSAAAT